ncbi:unnamed protein product, partial [Allacma fusca]
MTVLVYIEDSMIQKNQNKPCWIGGLRKQATGKNEDNTEGFFICPTLIVLDTKIFSLIWNKNGRR